ncbi:MAG: ABC transporter permease [Chloroflexota bacterium]|nr:ABC transporter permease [Chloroflexota bacterium]
MKALAIAGANLTRMGRDRLGLFFVVLLPIILVLYLGLQYGSSFSPKIGVHAEVPGVLGDQLIAGFGEIEPEAWGVVRFADEAALRDAVERGAVDAGLALPDRYDERVRAGETVEVEFLSPAGKVGIGIQETVRGIVAEQAARVRAARFAAAETGGSVGDQLAAVAEIEPTLPDLSVSTETAGSEIFPRELLGFALGAQSQLILFVFITSLTGATQLILTRTLGVSRRMLSTPTSSATILLGEALGRFGVAMIQALIIVIASALAFGVAWGDPLGTAAVVIAFSLVGAGAAMLIGAVASNPEQAGAIGLVGGLGFAAVGGCMVPPEVFPPIMQTISHFTPHAWAIDALRALAVHDANLFGVLPQVGVLAAFAAVLLGLATWRLRAALAG